MNLVTQKPISALYY